LNGLNKREQAGVQFYSQRRPKIVNCLTCLFCQQAVFQLPEANNDGTIKANWPSKVNGAPFFLAHTLRKLRRE